MDLAATQRLILSALDGGEPELGRLLEHLRPRLLLWSTGRLSPSLRGRVEPEDVVQEALLAVHRSIGTFEGRDGRAFLAWVFRIAENRIRDLADHFGARKRQPVPPPLTLTQTSPSTAASRREQVDRVGSALAGLPEDQRQVLVLRRFEEREVKEIAEIMGRSDNAVRILYCRAIKGLREAMLRDDGTASGPAA